MKLLRIDQTGVNEKPLPRYTDKLMDMWTRKDTLADTEFPGIRNYLGS